MLTVTWAVEVVLYPLASRISMTGLVDKTPETPATGWVTITSCVGGPGSTKENLLTTVGAAIYVLVLGLFATMEQVPAVLVEETVAVETPPEVVDPPTVQILVVCEVNVTADPEVAEAVMTRLDPLPVSGGCVKLIEFGNPTMTVRSMYIDAPTNPPPVASYDPLTNLNLYHPS